MTAEPLPAFGFELRTHRAVVIDLTKFLAPHEQLPMACEERVDPRAVYTPAERPLIMQLWHIVETEFGRAWRKVVGK